MHKAYCIQCYQRKGRGRKEEEEQKGRAGQGSGKSRGNFPVTFVPSEHSLSGTIKYDDANFLPLANSP